MTDLRDTTVRLERQWNRLARFNPMWAILTGPETLSGGMSEKIFFETGRNEVAVTLERVGGLGLGVRHGAALDFGCGMGRVTQGLCAIFERCEGVDVSGRMVRLARRHNRFPERCRYHLNTGSDLGLFADSTFDFAYSRLVLQHIPLALGRGYLAELARVTAPGGVLWLQAPGGLRDRPRNVAFEDGGYRARLEILSVTRSAAAGSRLEVTVRVRNAGTSWWPASGQYPVRLGNHWLNEGGELDRLDDGRANIGGGLAPGEEVVVVVNAHAPRERGRFLLELDLVHEGVTWFAHRGSAAVRCAVDVHDDDAPPQKAPARAVPWRRWTTQLRGVLLRPPPMDMHAYPRDELTSLLEDAGVKMVDVAEDDCCGAEWISYRYVGVKIEP